MDKNSMHMCMFLCASMVVLLVLTTLLYKKVEKLDDKCDKMMRILNPTHEGFEYRGGMCGSEEMRSH